MNMKNLKEIAMNKRINLDALICDLKDSWEFNKEDYILTGADWTTACDNQTLSFIKEIWKLVDGSYSLNSLATTIKNKKKIKWAVRYV